MAERTSKSMQAATLPTAHPLGRRRDLGIGDGGLWEEQPPWPEIQSAAASLPAWLVLLIAKFGWPVARPQDQADGFTGDGHGAIGIDGSASDPLACLEVVATRTGHGGTQDEEVAAASSPAENAAGAANQLPPAAVPGDRGAAMLEQFGLSRRALRFFFNCLAGRVRNALPIPREVVGEVEQSGQEATVQDEEVAAAGSPAENAAGAANQLHWAAVPGGRLFHGPVVLSLRSCINGLAGRFRYALPTPTLPEEPLNDDPIIKRHYDYTRTVIQVELALSLILAASHAFLFDFTTDTLFKISMSLLGLAVAIDGISMVGLMNSTNFSCKWSRACIYISNVCQVLAPYLLLISSNKLNACAILIVLLPPAVACIQHWACNSGGEGNGVQGNLEHIFEQASVVYSIAAAGGLIGLIWGGARRFKEPAPEGLVGLFVCLSIFLAIYLMLITTFRSPVLTRHADLLRYIMGSLLVASPLIAAAEFVSWRAAVGVLAVGAADAAFSYWLVMIRGPVSAEEDDASPTKSRRLLSANCTVILFGLVLHHHSLNAPAAGEASQFLDQARILLYFHAFTWSCSWMLVPFVEVAGGAVWVLVWSAFKLLRAAAVGLVVLDVVCRMVIFTWS